MLKIDIKAGRTQFIAIPLVDFAGERVGQVAMILRLRHPKEPIRALGTRNLRGSRL